MKTVRERVSLEGANVDEHESCQITSIEESAVWFDTEGGSRYYVAKPKRMTLEEGETIHFEDKDDDTAILCAEQAHPFEWVKHYDAKLRPGLVYTIEAEGDGKIRVVDKTKSDPQAWVIGKPTTFTVTEGDQLKMTEGRKPTPSAVNIQYVGVEGEASVADTANALLNELTKRLLGQSELGPNDVTVKREGAVITLPTGMSYAKAREWLTKKEEEENTKVAINEEVDAYVLDGAHAFMLALKDMYGWTEALPTPGFFGSTPPTYISIDKAVDEKIQILWGRVAVPAITGHFDTGFAIKDGNRVIFKISGETKQKHVPDVKKIADLTRQYAREHSLYKGKAIRVTFPNLDDEKFNPLTHAPRFIDTRNIKETDLVFPRDIAGLVETTLFTPIRATDACREARIPLKRGILLEGPFGTGKTLTANVTAMLAELHDWTFIYVEDVRRLHEAMRFAKQYQPAVIFAEDIDRADTYDEDSDQPQRSEIMNQILNTIDGVDMKDTEIMVVVTTNHVEVIHQAMLRPGRLDAVIPVRAPDAEAAERLVRLFSHTLLSPKEDLSRVGRKLGGNIPAVIREVVERSKLAAISRLTLSDTEWDLSQLKITAEDLEVAADGMIAHLNLLKEAQVDNRSDLEKAASIVAAAMVTPSREAKEGDLPHDVDIHAGYGV